MKTNIIIGILIVVIAAFLIFGGEKDDGVEVVLDENGEVLEEENTETTEGDIEVRTAVIASPVDWNTMTLGAITFDIPGNYYISNPVIDGCENVVSISAQDTEGASISAFMIYEAGCVTSTSITENYAVKVEANGFVFQSISDGTSFVTVLNKIADSSALIVEETEETEEVMEEGEAMEDEIIEEEA